MHGTKITKYIFLSILILSANTASAYNAAEMDGVVTLFFLIVGIVVFLFIMAAVNYFRKAPQEDEEDGSRNALPEGSEDNLRVKTLEEAQSPFVYVVRRSFLIFVVLIIVCIILATLNMK